MSIYLQIYLGNFLPFHEIFKKDINTLYNTTKLPVYYIPFKDALVRTFSVLYYALSKSKSKKEHWNLNL